MCENPRGVSSRSAVSGVLDARTIARWAAALVDVDRNATDEERITEIRELEVLKCAAEAAQSVLTADFDASQREEQALAGVPARQQGRGVAAQIALARRESPHKGQQHLGLAKILPTELPHALGCVHRRPHHGMAGDADRPGDRLPVARRPARGGRGAGCRSGAVGGDGGPGSGGRGAQAGLPTGSRFPRRTTPQGRLRPSRHDSPGAGHDDLPDRTAAGRAGRGRLRRVDAGRRLGSGERRPEGKGPDHGRHSGRAGDWPALGRRCAAPGQPGHLRRRPVRCRRPRPHRGLRSGPRRPCSRPGCSDPAEVVAPALRLTRHRRAGGDGVPLAHLP